MKPKLMKIDDFKKCITGASGCKCNIKPTVWNNCCRMWEKHLPDSEEIQDIIAPYFVGVGNKPNIQIRGIVKTLHKRIHGEGK